jgi:hypothetical protein
MKMLIQLRSSALFAAVACGLIGCAASAPRPAAMAPAPPALDASYDWHVLVTAPFGSMLKDMPLALHEVLLFRDEDRHSVEADEPECYAVNGSAPRFVARTPNEYLLCFRHDHLARIEAVVAIRQDEAATIFSAACGLWLKLAALPAATDATPGVCEGNDGVAAFSGRLEPAQDQDATLSVKIDAVANAVAPPADKQ